MNALIKDCIKLVTITVIAGAALGAVYGITKAPIQPRKKRRRWKLTRLSFRRLPISRK